MTALSELLRGHWKTQGLRLAPGASEQEVRDFEGRYGVVLPNDFRGYILNTNGMLQDASRDFDSNGFSFWPLVRVKTVVEECAALSRNPPDLADRDRYFVFADYLQWSWAYAIYLTDVPPKTNPVIFLGLHSPKVVAPSFTNFVELYLQDARELYPD